MDCRACNLDDLHHLAQKLTKFEVVELRSGDLCVLGSESFADNRTQLLPWDECLARLPAYCEKVGLPSTAKEFVASLKEQLESTAQQLDDKFPSCRGDVSINDAGASPRLRGSFLPLMPLSWSDILPSQT